MGSTVAETLVSSVVLRRALAYAESRGVDASAVRDAIGVREADVAAPDGVVPFPALLEAFVHLAERTGDPLFGLNYASALVCKDVGILGYLLLAAPDLDQALRTVAVAHDELRAGSDMRAEVDPPGVSVLDDDRPGYPHWAQGCLASFLVCARQATGARVVPLAVELPGPPDEARGEAWARFAGVAPTFGGRRYAIRFRAEDAHRPFVSSDPELFAHLRAAAARMAEARRAPKTPREELVHLVGCAVDLAHGEVRRGDHRVKLTTKEAQALRYLAERPNQVVPQRDLEEAVWRFDPKVLSRAPAVALRRLRRKIEPDPASPVNLVTVFGEGWRLMVRDPTTDG